jgi:hypothetical protein
MDSVRAGAAVINMFEFRTEKGVLSVKRTTDGKHTERQ